MEQNQDSPVADDDRAAQRAEFQEAFDDLVLFARLMARMLIADKEGVETRGFEFLDKDDIIVTMPSTIPDSQGNGSWFEIYPILFGQFRVAKASKLGRFEIW